jgi:pyruvate/2-oxoacid:ferredoxin oxidoreductase alpha subunit
MVIPKAYPPYEALYREYNHNHKAHNKKRKKVSRSRMKNYKRRYGRKKQPMRFYQIQIRL